MNKFSKRIAGEDMYLEFLQAINGILLLTDRELKILADIIEFDILYAKRKDIPKNILDANNRFLLMERHKIGAPNLTTLIKKLVEKGCIIKRGDIVEVSRSLIPVVIGDRLQITLILRLPDAKSKDADKGIRQEGISDSP